MRYNILFLKQMDGFEVDRCQRPHKDKKVMHQLAFSINVNNNAINSADTEAAFAVIPNSLTSDKGLKPHCLHSA